MAITAAQVNELRQKTGAGMMDCKKALTEANGDFEKAIEILRKKGASVASKRAEKSANEGIVVTKVSDDNRKASMIEVNCETDFVAKSEDFVKLAKAVVESAYKAESSDSKQLLESDKALNNMLVDVMGKVGEKVEVSRVLTLNAENGLIIDYIHMGSKLGVLVKFDNVPAKNDELVELGKNLAMQVAAMNPLCVYREEVPSATIEKEIDIYKELARKEGKPENILEKIATGKLNKFYAENCLFEQTYIKDSTSSKTISNLMDEYNKKNDTQTKIGMFKRFHLGDENK
ncbi:MAG TPA: translation elongation factor Ts [Ignavibacteriaceae bacterium]|jgi:elongation factor Ts|nr:MAG: Elongation factor Ts [Ignavibacteria bacterium ADurb.Bin266]OQY74111.1 MAG: translation elongation factor Ts [Ignavibacteriales bacterium UTCHB2]HQF41507.1 translation elongation factor Ts [Ignavibacteriaceae bacterium]HQI41977.1 translation elongation factor Ts [Ignavibacteriaceae bacterium]